MSSSSSSTLVKASAAAAVLAATVAAVWRLRNRKPASSEAKAEEEDKVLQLPADSVMVTCSAPVNIAVIKYWGKRDEELILPVNSSLSATIDKGSMRSRTIIIASKTFASDTMQLNGKAVPLDKNPRMVAVIKQLRARAQPYVEGGRVLIAAEDWPKYKLQITSDNNFPTAAGLASSASGFACLTKCLAALFNVSESFESELTSIARQGSGSACRSLYGGFVKWEMGVRPDGRDSIAVQVAPETHWPEMRVLILVANSGPKDVGSTDGMRVTVQTSPLLQKRIEIVPGRMKQMEAAIRNRDFNAFGELTMMDSNQFHSVCLDTYPPLFYLNDTSKRIIEFIHALNEEKKSIVAAYTFDAGPNAVVYVEEKHLNWLLDQCLRKFYVKQRPIDEFVVDPLHLARLPAVASADKTVNGVDRIIVSKVGAGAEVHSKAHSFA